MTPLFTRPQMYQVIDDMFRRVQNMRDPTGKSYAPDLGRPFSNFEDEAQELGVSREYVLLTRALKHWTAIKNYIKADAPNRQYMDAREPISRRVEDLVLYVGIFEAMMHEEQTRKDPRNFGSIPLDKAIHKQREELAHMRMLEITDLKIDSFTSEIHMTMTDGITHVMRIAPGTRIEASA